MVKISEKYRTVLLESVVEHLYTISLELQKLKGGPMTNRRKELTKKQNFLEELQHLLSVKEN